MQAFDFCLGPFAITTVRGSRWEVLDGWGGDTGGRSLLDRLGLLVLGFAREVAVCASCASLNKTAQHRLTPFIICRSRRGRFHTPTTPIGTLPMRNKARNVTLRERLLWDITVVRHVLIIMREEITH